MAVLATGAVFAQTAAAPAAPKPAASSANPAAGIDRNALSYGLGYDMAIDMANHHVDLDIQTLIRGIQEGYAKKAPSVPEDKYKAALKAFETKMIETSRANFEKLIRENKTKSDAFLAANKAKPGVTSIAGGIQYRIIEPGTGPKPTGASNVSVHLRGSLSTGQEFFNTYSTANAQPASFKMSEFPSILPAGLRDVLLMMPVGSRWEIYIPSSKAYGDDPRSPIGPAQAVVFDVKLVGAQ
jgi:peptidylprolyl isomerase